MVPNQARFFVGPVLGPNCLSRLFADDTSRQRKAAIKLAARLDEISLWSLRQGNCSATETSRNREFYVAVVF